MRPAALLFVLWQVAAAQAAAPAVVQRYQARALDPDSGRLLYTEQHLVRSPAPHDGASTAARQRLVLYRCPDGQLFARKRVDYREDSPAAPAFSLEDARFGYREGVRADAGRWLAFLRRDAGSAPQTGVVEPGNRLVIDAGFDEFVRAQWNRLQAGDTVALDFLVPSRLRTYGFTLRRVGAIELETGAATRFRLSLGGLLGWFAPDITVTYRNADRRLLRFEGLTNIRANRDDNVVARVEFAPAPDAPRGGMRSWNAALAEPLAACALGG